MLMIMIMAMLMMTLTMCNADDADDDDDVKERTLMTCQAIFTFKGFIYYALPLQKPPACMIGTCI